MFDLAMSVLCSSVIFVIFRLFAVYKVNTLLAIITNYMVACSCGLFFSAVKMPLSGLVAQSWFFLTVFLGILFILVFNIMAKSSQVNGVGVTSVATKMSLVVPVIFSVLYYKEALSFFQLLGILLALVAVWLASAKANGRQLSQQHLWLPILVFLGSGLIDTSLKFIQEGFLTDSEFPIFSATVFGTAATAGLLFVGIKSTQQKVGLNFRSVLGGIVLGVPNYFSIYFLLRALNQEGFNSSAIFTINNVAIVLFSTLLGITLFKEKLSVKNWLGVGIAIVSIVLVALL